jgi:hypothetical protein
MIMCFGFYPCCCRPSNTRTTRLMQHTSSMGLSLVRSLSVSPAVSREAGEKDDLGDSVGQFMKVCCGRTNTV